MPHEHHHGSEQAWLSCTLCRSHRQSSNLLAKARQREVSWPKPKQYSGGNPVQDPAVYTTIDDAFSHVLQYMSTTTRQCKRYYHSASPQTVSSTDHSHCDRFHTPAYTRAQHANPLQRAEDVHVVVNPGSYAVTAGEWGTQRQQTHVVNLQSGQNLNLDFVM